MAVINHLLELHRLRNRYFIMRHGQSKANVRQLIVSHPDSGAKDEFGLTELGKEQSEAAASKSGLGEDTVIYCSDFSRARQTAEIVRRTLRAPGVELTPNLRERFFGNWESSDDTNYHKVWATDVTCAPHTDDSVETTEAVLDRATQLIVDLERSHENQKILLVSHGDTLQILQTGFQKINPAQHRDLPNLEVAGIRELKLRPVAERAS